jgi:hypothetical protein
VQTDAYTPLSAAQSCQGKNRRRLLPAEDINESQPPFFAQLGIDGGVNPAFAKQLRMKPFSGNHSLIQHQDPVGYLDRREQL